MVYPARIETASAAAPTVVAMQYVLCVIADASLAPHLWRPFSLLDMVVNMVVPPLPALLARPPGKCSGKQVPGEKKYKKGENGTDENTKHKKMVCAKKEMKRREEKRRQQDWLG